VFAIDGSAQMLAAVRDRVGVDSSRVEMVQADLNDPLPMLATADAIFSVATLHWLPDHATVFAHMSAALRPGGQLVAECGGLGNISMVSAAVNAVLGDDASTQVWNFAGPEETRERLAVAGFTDIDVVLVPDLVTFDDDGILDRYLETVVLGAHIESMSAGARTVFAHSVAARLPRREIDYIRLTIKARKHAEPASDADDHRF
jgi:trans-aconitate 2-methyltransferase